MENRHSLVRRSIVCVTLALVATVSAVACNQPEANEDVGVVRIAITQVPTDVRCIRIQAKGSGEVVRSFTVTPGASSVLELTSIPVGTVAFSANAFNATCSNVVASTAVTWSSDPVSAQITSGATTNVNLVMRRSGGASVSVDFQTCNTGTHTCNGACVSNSGVNSCGLTSCTPCPAPTNGVATCDGTACGAACSAGFHLCGTACVADNNVNQCGSACMSCVQPNAVAACANGACANTCVGGAAATLACPAVGGKPNCSRWSFESSTPEGWVYDSAGGSPWAGTGQVITASTAMSTPAGGRSLSVGFSYTGTASSPHVFIRVPLCAGGQSLNLAGKSFRASVRMVTAPGTPPFDNGQGHHVQLYNGSTRTGAFGDFSVNPTTGGGDTAGSWYQVNADLSTAFGSDNVTHIGFRLLFNMAWTGTIFIDDIQII